MKNSASYLTAAVQIILWPYLKTAGFTKITPRKFSREKNNIFQQIWVDANGVSGSKSTRIVLCCNFPFGSVNGYKDPHGFQLSHGKTWDMSTQASAEYSMQEVVEALNSSELRTLDDISNFTFMLSSLEGLDRPPRSYWYAQSAELYEKWLREDPETLKLVAKNRQALKP